MRQFFLFISLFTLCSCQEPIVEQEIVKQDITLGYPNDKKIVWNEVFNQTPNDYLVYFYSETCGHCLELKKDILNFFYSYHGSFYFVESSSYFVYMYDIENTIGANNIKEFAILGTPTLVEIKGRKVNKNIAGVNKIRDFIS